MRLVFTALAAGALGAAFALWQARPVPLADRVKLSTGRAVLQRKQAMVDCMAYTAGKVLGIERQDRATDAACESLAGDFISAMPQRDAPAPAPPTELTL